jgi:prepilin-type N-terminal cleavage/methylation domain-containing protein
MRKGFVRCWDGFTLIELLIVVASIAILAASAVPNFLQAQTRAKVSRVTSDHRSLTIALEQYRVDNGVYVPHVDDIREFYPLTTPVAYMNSVPKFRLRDVGQYVCMGWDIIWRRICTCWQFGWSDPGRDDCIQPGEPGGCTCLEHRPDLTHNCTPWAIRSDHGSRVMGTFPSRT